jgi:hypothetical protein
MEKKMKGFKRAAPAGDILETHRKAFKASFGREPTGDDPLIFGPGSDVPEPYSVDKFKAEMLAAMRKAGVQPEIMYAFEKTGLFPKGNADYDRMLPEDREQWDAAIDQYFSEAKRSRS